MNIVFQDRTNRILEGDCLDLDTELGMDWVDLIVTSPPYNLDKDYGSCDDLHPNSYHHFIKSAARAMWNACKEGGRLCLNIPLDVSKPSHIPTYAEVVQGILLGSGWKYRTTIVWNEQNISKRTAWGSWRSPSAPNIITPVEMIVVFYKGEWKKGSGEKPDITAEEFKEWTLGHWTFPGESAKRIGHPAPFPEELARRCIKLFSYPGDVVLDPFLGSGTTYKVATALGRTCTGVDISREYCELAMARCNK